MQAQKDLERMLIHVLPVVTPSMHQYFARYCPVDLAMQPSMVTGAILNYNVKSELRKASVDAWRLDAHNEVRSRMHSLA